MKDDEITQMGLSSSTAQSGLESELRRIIQVIFDQHLQVDVETVGGRVFANVFVRPVKDGVFLNAEQQSGANAPVKGSTFVPEQHIASISFRDDRDYRLVERP